MSDLTLLTGAGIFLAGMGAGRFWPSRRRRPAPPKPECGCGHVISFHKDGSSKCHGIRKGYFTAQCTCQQYTGPQPLPEFYAPEIAP